MTEQQAWLSLAEQWDHIIHEINEMGLFEKPFWLIPRENIKQRADFCRKMAAICEGESNVR